MTHPQYDMKVDDEAYGEGCPHQDDKKILQKKKKSLTRFLFYTYTYYKQLTLFISVYLFTYC